MKWFKTYADIVNDPKRYDLEEKIGTVHGLHYIVCWFAYVAKYAEDGDVTKLTASQIERACEWKGKAGEFYGALTVCGFIDKIRGGDGGFRLIAHNWFHENARFIKENEKRKPLGNPRETLGKPLLQDSTLQDKTVHKRNTAPTAYTEVFENFWKAYPARKGKKQGKKPAWEVWRKLNPTSELLVKIMKGVDAIKNEEYPKDAERWLKREGWADDLQATKSGCQHDFRKMSLGFQDGEMKFQLKCHSCGVVK